MSGRVELNEHRLLLLERKYHLPVALHVDNRPMIGWREVERHVEAAEMRLPIVGVFAFGIGMMDEHAEPIAVGIAEGSNRAATDVLIDSNRFPGLVVNEIDGREAEQRRYAVAHDELRL